MSSQQPIFIMWGLMLPYPKFKDADDDGDSFHELTAPFSPHTYDDSSMNPKNDTAVIVDGMGSKYVAVGHVFARSGAYGDDLGGPYTLPMLYPAFDPCQDPDVIVQFATWRANIEKTLKEIDMHTASLGLSFGWHVIQAYR